MGQLGSKVGSSYGSRYEPHPVAQEQRGVHRPLRVDGATAHVVLKLEADGAVRRGEAVGVIRVTQEILLAVVSSF